MENIRRDSNDENFDWTVRYRCDNCGENGYGEYYNIEMRGWRPLCLCEECIKDMKVWNES